MEAPGRSGLSSWDGRILFLCPICEHGVQFVGAEALPSEKKRIGKASGGVAAAQFAMDAQRKVVELQRRFDLTHIRRWYGSLSVLNQRATRKLVQRLGLFALLEQLK